MVVTKSFVAILLFACSAFNVPQTVHGQVQAAYSTTFTTTTTSTTTSFTPTVTQTSSTTLADELTTTTTTVQTTLNAATTTTTTVLDAATSTVSLAAATQTVVNTKCVEYALKFDKGCCPTKYLHKTNGHPHPHPHPEPHPHPQPSHPQALPRSWPVRRSDRARFGKRAISGPVPTTSSCSVSSFMDFFTSYGSRTPIVTAYDFGVGGRMRIQDLYAVNVCGDVYVDGVLAGSTNCPALHGANLGDSQNDPDQAIATGNYAYTYIDVPAGIHTVEFQETYSGGQAFYQISSKAQCPALAYIDEQVTTVYQTATETTTKTVGPTSTQVDVVTETNTNTLADIVEVVTSTPAAATTTIVPAPIQTAVNQCKQVTVNVSCPKFKKQNMLDQYLLDQLNATKKKNGGNGKQPLQVTCAGSKNKYEF